MIYEKRPTFHTEHSVALVRDIPEEQFALERLAGLRPDGFFDYVPCWRQQRRKNLEVLGPLSGLFHSTPSIRRCVVLAGADSR